MQDRHLTAVQGDRLNAPLGEPGPWRLHSGFPDIENALPEEGMVLVIASRHKQMSATHTRR